MKMGEHTVKNLRKKLETTPGIRIKMFLRNTIQKTLNTIPLLKKGIATVRRKILESYPQVVQAETTTACNADCIMCPHSKMTKKRGHMDFELYKKIVDDCASHPLFVKRFFPFLNGEFFLMSQWKDYLSYARDKLPYTKIGIFTNGSLLNTDSIRKLLEIQPDWINISFDGTSKQTFEQIRRNLKFEQVQENVLQLIKLRDSSGKTKPYITISIIKMEQTATQLQSFYEKWSSIVDRVTVEPYSNWGGLVKNSGVEKQTLSKRMPCSRLWYNFTILATGEAVICCLDCNGEIIIGDIKKQSIREIWKGEKMTELRNLHLKNKYDDISLCKDCAYGKHHPEPLIGWY